MAASDLPSSSKEINPATDLLTMHPRGLDKNDILCRVDAWHYGIPDGLFNEAVRNGEIECTGDVCKITERGKSVVGANRHPKSDSWPPPPPEWDD